MGLTRQQLYRTAASREDLKILYGRVALLDLSRRYGRNYTKLYWMRTVKSKALPHTRDGRHWWDLVFPWCDTLQKIAALLSEEPQLKCKQPELLTEESLAECDALLDRKGDSLDCLSVSEEEEPQQEKYTPGQSLETESESGNIVPLTLHEISAMLFAETADEEHRSSIYQTQYKLIRPSKDNELNPLEPLEPNLDFRLINPNQILFFMPDQKRFKYNLRRYYNLHKLLFPKDSPQETFEEMTAIDDDFSLTHDLQQSTSQARSKNHDETAFVRTYSITGHCLISPDAEGDEHQAPSSDEMIQFHEMSTELWKLHHGHIETSDLFMYMNVFMEFLSEPNMVLILNFMQLCLDVMKQSENQDGQGQAERVGAGLDVETTLEGAVALLLKTPRTQHLRVATLAGFKLEEIVVDDDG